MFSVGRLISIQLIAGSILLLICGSAGGAMAADRPNVVVILADDQGLEAASITVESIVTWSGGATSLYFRDLDEHLVELMTRGFWRLTLDIPGDAPGRQPE